MDPVSIALGGASILSGVFSSILGNSSQAKQQNASLEWQRHENAIARQHNMALAEAQNNMNIAQWNRENAYNSPAAQMQRYKAAGLNPNLIYGQQNTSAQLSGQLTAGAPTSAPDMSKFIDQNRGNRLSSMFSKLGDVLMQIPMYAEQVKSARLDNELKKEELIRSTYETDFQDFIHSMELDESNITELLKGKISPAKRKYMQDFVRYQKEIEDKDEDIKLKRFKSRLNDATFDHAVKQVAAAADLADNEARLFAETYVARKNKIQYDEKEAKARMQLTQAQEENYEFDRIFNMIIKGGDIALRALETISELFPVGKAAKVVKSFNKMRKVGENTYVWE